MKLEQTAGHKTGSVLWDSTYTELAKTFVKVFPLHRMKKPEGTFWPKPSNIWGSERASSVPRGGSEGRGLLNLLLISSVSSAGLAGWVCVLPSTHFFVGLTRRRRTRLLSKSYDVTPPRLVSLMWKILNSFEGSKCYVSMELLIIPDLKMWGRELNCGFDFSYTILFSFSPELAHSRYSIRVWMQALIVFEWLGVNPQMGNDSGKYLFVK